MDARRAVAITGYTSIDRVMDAQKKRERYFGYASN